MITHLLADRDYKKQGKKNRASGKAFELKVRKNLEEQGWIVFRNSNDVDLVTEDILSKEGKRIGVFKQAKSKWNPFTRMPMTLQSGFPDFICVTRAGEWKVMFVECKTNSYLDKEEKAKVQWIRDNLHIDVLVAFKGEKRGKIEYERA